jgi:hypothetical protein
MQAEFLVTSIENLLSVSPLGQKYVQATTDYISQLTGLQ